MSRALAPMRHAAFRNLALGRTISMLGNAVAPIALAFAVLDLTGSAADLGLVVGARSLTNVVFLLFGGVVADRLPRQLVMVVAAVSAALTQGAVAAVVLTHNATVPLLMVLGAVNGVASAFAFPAAAALIAQTIPPEQRTAANALNRLGINAATIVGASLGGLLVAAVGPGWGLAVDAATFAVAGLCFSRVRVADHRRTTAPEHSPLRDLREGWSAFAGRPWVWVVVLGFCFFNMAVAGAKGVVGPVLADQTFGRPAWGYVLAAETAGMMLGALIAMRLRLRRLLFLGVAGCLGEVVLLATLAQAPQIAVVLPVALLGGVAIEQFGIAWEVSMQEHIPANLLARVYSYDALGSFIAIPAGQVLAGPLVAATDVKVCMTVAAGVALLAVVGMLASRSVRTLEHRRAPAGAQPDEPLTVAQPDEPPAAAQPLVNRQPSLTRS